MPIYEYECEKCGKVHEAWQKISDAPLTKCEQCKGKLHKLISRSSFHLKGSGWYATDYAGKSGAAGSTASETGSQKSGSSGQQSKAKTAKSNADKS